MDCDAPRPKWVREYHYKTIFYSNQTTCVATPKIPWWRGFWWPKELSRHGHNQHICITYNDVMTLTHTKTAAMLLRHHPTHHIRPQMACMPHYTSTIANIRCSMQQVGTMHGYLLCYPQHPHTYHIDTLTPKPQQHVAPSKPGSAHLVSNDVPHALLQCSLLRRCRLRVGPSIR